MSIRTRFDLHVYLKLAIEKKTNFLSRKTKSCSQNHIKPTNTNSSSQNYYIAHLAKNKFYF